MTVKTVKTAEEILDEFSFECEEVAKNNFDYEDKWTAESTKYKITIERNGKAYTTPFYCGKLANYPTLNDVIYSFLIDNTRGMNLEEFASYLGYELNYDEEQHKKIKRIFEGCKQETRYLLTVFSMEELEVIEKHFENY